VAREGDLAAIDELTAVGYRGIWESYVAMLEYWQDLSALNPGSTP
jgi:hypothetical protein